MDLSSSLDAYKAQAAAVAVALVEPGMTLGLGTGSTSAIFLELLAQRAAAGELPGLLCVATSVAVEERARRFGLDVRSLDECPVLDLTVDGADEIDPDLNVIKGGGGALLREKIVAQASRRLVLVADHSKVSPMLGVTWPVPIEVIPFGWRTHLPFFAELGAEVAVRTTAQDAPYHTDQGNLILDCRFGPIHDLEALAGKLGRRAGLVEHGLFLRMADEVIVAAPEGIRRMARAKNQLTAKTQNGQEPGR